MSQILLIALNDKFKKSLKKINKVQTTVENNLDENNKNLKRKGSC